MFTDDDLKRLKENIANYQMAWDRDEQLALLARLEAAEKCLGTDCFPHCAVFDRGNYCDCGYEAWRKSKGE